MAKGREGAEIMNTIGQRLKQTKEIIGTLVWAVGLVVVYQLLGIALTLAGWVIIPLLVWVVVRMTWQARGDLWVKVKASMVMLKRVWD